MNYHGFAASLLDRYGVLAGFEPGARVLNQAQREEICGRVLDRMTFDHAAATYQPSLVGKILELDDQLQNHRVAPTDALAWLTDRLETLKNHRSDRSYRAAEERIELTEAAIAVPRAEGGARRDRLRRPDRPRHRDRGEVPGRGRRPPRSVPGGAARRVSGHERRAGGADVGALRRRPPGHRGRRPRPEHLRVARRVALQPVPVPDRLPQSRRHRGGTAAALHELPVGRADPGGGGHGDRPRARGATSAGQAARPVGRQRAGRGAGAARARRVDRGAARSPTGASSCTTTGSPWSEMAVLCRTSRLFGLLRQALRRAGRAGRDRRARGAAEDARGRRGARVRARGAGPDGERGARADPAGTPLPGRVQGHRAASRGSRRSRPRVCARPTTSRTTTSRPSRSCSPRRSSISTRSRACPTRGARGSPSSATSSRALRAEARRPVGEFLGEVIRRIGILDELDADPDRRHGARRAAQPRRVPRRGPRVRARRGRAHAPRVPRLRGRGRARSTSRSGRRCSRPTPTRSR